MRVTLTRPIRSSGRVRAALAALAVVGILAGGLATTVEFVAAPPAAASVPAPYHHWTFEASGSGLVEDSGSSSYDWNFGGSAHRYPGVSGESQYAAGGVANANTAEFTADSFAFAAYIQPDRSHLPLSDRAIIASRRVFGWTLYFETTGELKADFYTKDSGGDPPDPSEVDTLTGPSVLDGAWHQVAFAFSGGVGHLYLDGAEVDSESGRGDSVVYTPDGSCWDGFSMAEGEGCSSAHGLYYGLVDEFAYWNTAVTPGDMLSEFQRQQGFVPDGEKLGGGSLGATNVCQPGAGHPVTLSTGNFYESVTDLGVASRGPGVQWTRTFNSLAATTNRGLGYGWTSNYDMALIPIGTASSPGPDGATAGGGAGGLRVRQENGSNIDFAWADSSHTALLLPPRVFASLTYNSGDDTYTYIRRKHEIFTFYSPSYSTSALQGKLKSLSDLEGNTTSLSYDSSGRLQFIEPADYASTGRRLTLTWAGSDIDYITDPAGRKVDYGITAGELVSVTDVRGYTTTIAYQTGGTHRLESVTDPRSHVITYNHYDGFGRVDYQQDGATYGTSAPVRKLEFAYTSGETTVTHPEGNIDVYRFGGGACLSKTFGSGSSEAATWSYTLDPSTLAPHVVAVNAGSSVSSPVTQRTYTYDASGNVLTDTDGLNHAATAASYNAYNRPGTVQDRNGTTTTNTYDGTKPWRLNYTSTPITPAQGGMTAAVTAYHYDTNGDLLQAADPNHVTNIGSYPSESTKRWTYTYGSFGQVESITDPTTAGNETTFGYDIVGHQVWTVSPRGNSGTPGAYLTATIADQAGLPTVTVSADGAPRTDGFNRADSSGVSLGSTDTGQAWTALGSSQWTSLNGQAKLVSAGSTPLATIAAPSSHGTLSFASPTAQDGLGVAFRVQNASNYWALHATPTSNTWTLSKTVSGSTTTVGTTGGSTCCTASDRVSVSFSDVAADSYPVVVKINGVTKLTTTDGALATQTGVGLKASATGSGRLDDFAVYAATGGESSATYDEDGNRVRAIDPLGNITTWHYDNANRLTQVDRADGTQLETAFDYNSRMVSQTDGDGQVTAYGYDDLDRVELVTNPTIGVAGGGTFARTSAATYNPTGTVDTVTDAFSPARTTTFGYDAANRTTSINYSDSGTPDVTSIGYDNNGNRTSMVDGTGKSCYSVDTLNRVYSYTNGGGSPSSCTGNTVNYVYDANGNATTIGYTPSIAVTRTFDDANRMDSVSDFLSTPNTTTWAYDEDSHVTLETNPNNTTTAYGYSPAGSLTGITHKQGATTIAAYTYTRDLANQLTASATAPGSTTDTYAYTQLNQVGATSFGAYSYTYDDADNLTRFPAGSTMTYNAANQARVLSNVFGTPQGCYEYDNNGQRIKRTVNPVTSSLTACGTGTSSTSYGYDQAGRLTGIPGTSTYSYNGDGLRTKTNVLTGITTFTSDIASGGLAKTIATTSGASNDYFLYDPTGKPFERINVNGANIYATWLHHDQQGSTRLITAPSTGATWGTYTYNPYGAVLNHVDNTLADGDPNNTNLGSIRLQYNGEWSDGDTNFQYLRARYYDSATGQFISFDPIASVTRAPYGYAAGSPVNASDPSGLYWGEDVVNQVVNTGVSISTYGRADCLTNITCNQPNSSLAQIGATSLKEDHPYQAQAIADGAGGYLNGISFGNAQQLIGGRVNWGSAANTAGDWIGWAMTLPFALQAPVAYGAASSGSALWNGLVKCKGTTLDLKSGINCGGSNFGSLVAGIPNGMLALGLKGDSAALPVIGWASNSPLVRDYSDFSLPAWAC